MNGRFDGMGVTYMRTSYPLKATAIPQLHTEQLCPGVDVKVYAVGDEYAHAEARKVLSSVVCGEYLLSVLQAPTLDGKVLRDHGGNEVNVA